MKLYLFYLNHELYAITNDKILRDSFISERNMEKFTMKKVSVKNDEEYQNFIKFYKNQWLDDFVYGREEYIHMAATYKEDCDVEDEMSRITSELCEVTESLLNEPDIRCRDDIKYLSDVTIKRQNSWNMISYLESKIDTLTIFIKLFKDTL